MKNKFAITVAILVFLVGSVFFIRNPNLLGQVLLTPDIHIEITANGEPLNYLIEEQQAASTEDPGFLLIYLPITIETNRNYVPDVELAVQDSSSGNFSYAGLVQPASSTVEFEETERGMNLTLDPSQAPYKFTTQINRYHGTQLDYEIFINTTVEKTLKTTNQPPTT